MGRFLSCPLFTSLMVLLILGSIVGFLVGGWLLVVSQFFYSSSMAVTATKNHAGIKMANGSTHGDIDLIYYTLVIIGILVIFLSFVLLWIASEIFLLVSRGGYKTNWIRDYKRQIEDNWSTAALFQRRITF